MDSEPILDRRRQRSDVTADALDFQLAAVCERFAFDDLVLVSPEGFILAAADEPGEGTGIETLDLDAVMRLREDVPGVVVRTLAISAFPAKLVILSETARDVSLAVAQVSNGVERILAETSPTGRREVVRQVVVL